MGAGGVARGAEGGEGTGAGEGAGAGAMGTLPAKRFWNENAMGRESWEVGAEGGEGGGVSWGYLGRVGEILLGRQEGKAGRKFYV